MSVLKSTILSSVTGEGDHFVAGVVGVAVILGTTAVYYVLSSKDKECDFPKLPGIQLYHARNFFRRRHDFIHSHLEQNLGRGFSFNVLHHNVVVLTGADARQDFFSNPHLNFVQGYSILRGAVHVPRITDADIAAAESVEGDDSPFTRKLTKILSRGRIRDVIPMLLQDITKKFDKWGNDGKAGRIDPFIETYDLMFATTARILTCRDLIKNEADLKKVGELLEAMQTNVSPTSLVLPWFPSLTKRAQQQATTELCTILYTYIEARRHAELTNDAIDLLIAGGEATQDITGFVIRALSAGISNTSTVLYWTLINLAINSEWREKCKKEIQHMLSCHLGDSPSAALYEKFGAIPISVWDDELPTLEACARETQRILGAGIALRRNLREDTKIGGRVVKRGDFLVYSFGEAHVNPEYYPEPHKYDPGRWLRPDPVPNAPYPFLGWGAGRHPCTGMKVAKLEIKLALAMFLTRYEFDLVDEDGKFPDPLPAPDKNGFNGIRPLGTYYFNFRKVVD